jgi:hypothetical protein
MRTVLRAIALLLLFVFSPVSARLVSVSIESVEPFAPGTTFGSAGAYERVRGVFRGELDPTDARNRVIVNLDKAPRNAAGRIEYEADFFMLRPADPAKSNGKLIYDVTNRGRIGFLQRLTDSRSRTNDPKIAAHAGEGFFFRDGYTFVWSGWDPDAPTRGGGMSIRPIVATDGGAPITRMIREEFVSGTRARGEGHGGSRSEGAVFRLTYEAATLATNEARLTVRKTEGAPRREVSATGWAFVNERSIRLMPAGTAAETGSIYEFHYRAKNPRVLGIGMAATRDFVAFLRYGGADAKGIPNPAGTMKRALAVGSSQSGRFLRDFVRDGFNQAESARKVFDGVMAHTAGAGGVFFNEEFAQPNRTSTQHEDYTFPESAFPFSTARMTDPVTGKTGALFRGDGFDPLWIETNTSTEYWQKGASLVITDPLGTHDVELPANARSYLFTGTQHGGTAWMKAARGSCVNTRNPHSPTPVQRALLVALDEWVDGKPPPASRVPRIADGTLAPVENVAIPAIPGIQVAKRASALGVIRDWVKPEVDLSKPYRVLVPQVYADGNEMAGVMLPDIAVPLATYTGWNLYRAPFPEGVLCDRDGTYAPFARTRAEREARKDPRLSVEERYASHANYVARYEEAVDALVRERLLLPEDGERYKAKVRSSEIANLFTQPTVEQAAR